MARVLFVCLGNICRSPTAEAIFRDLVQKRGYRGKITTDSAGTGGSYAGTPPDARARVAGLKRGYDMGDLRARQVRPSDFSEFDYILAMDKSNLSRLKALCPEDFSGHLSLMLDFSGKSDAEVPDPFYGDSGGFELVLDLLEQAAEDLLGHIERHHDL